MKESKSILFLYRTIPGRVLLKFLVNPSVSEAASIYLDSGASRPLIDFFVKKNEIDLGLFDIPRGGYKSFNDFFIRKMKNEPVMDKGKMICPCDGLLTVKDIDEDLVFDIKKSLYSVKDLLRIKSDKAFTGGKALIFRLTPAHYHRYVFPVEGKIKYQKKIKGILHSVRPVCHEYTNVFTENSREYVIIDSVENGYVVQMEVGALMIGKISNFPINAGAAVHKGTPKGYFEYGGSSIVLLVQKGFELSESLKSRKKIDGEIPVHIGETLMD